MTGCSIVLRLASLLIPSGQRTEWLAEWNAELWYVQLTPGSAVLSFTLGAFSDAMWLRRNPTTRRTWLESPWKTLSVLGSMAAAAAVLFVYLFDRAAAPHTFSGWRVIVIGYLFVIAVAFLLNSLTSFRSSGEYPVALRFHRWAFLATKFLLLGVIVVLGDFDIVKLASSSLTRKMAHPMALQPQIALVLFVLAFRWAIDDQRRRCPVCLRRLKESASIGQFSHNVLEWYGIELFCVKGHGLLHVPQIVTTYSAERWCRLDRSWSVLFP